MGNTGDFEIENGVLKKFKGTGGDVSIPDGVTSIGEYAFSDCRGVKRVRIPSGVVSIGEGAFSYCGDLKSVEIPAGVTSIGNCVFCGCENLKGVHIPDSVTSIGEYAFSGCRGLKRVRIPSGVVSIGEGAFSYCEDLKSVEIPAGVTSIGNCVFWGCEKLKGVHIPDSVTSIGDYALAGCGGQESFYIVNGRLVDYIGPGEDVVIPEGVTYISEYMFYFCDGLLSVTIPRSVREIGYHAFYGTTNLQTLICYSPEAVDFIMGRDDEFLQEVLQEVWTTTSNDPDVVYLGGPLSDLEYQYEAVRGFFYAREHGITEIEQWKDGYLEFIRDYIDDYIEEAKEDRSVLMCLIKEKLLDEEGVKCYLKKNKNTDDIEVKAALLQYWYENFGTEGEGDLSI